MTMSCKLNQVVTKISTVVPDMATLKQTGQINTAPGMQLVIWQRPLSPFLLVRITRSSLLSATSASNIPSLSYFRCASAL